MNLKDRLSRIVKPAPPGTPTLAELFPDTTPEQIKADIAEARKGKVMSLSFRDIDAEDEAVPPRRIAHA
jgi:hypothetical protein